MKEKLLKIIIFTFGIICLYLSFAIRFFPLTNAILTEKMDKETREFSKYGELYYHSCIPAFRVEFGNQYGKYTLSTKNADIVEADILTYGDSFFDLAFQKCIPELLADTLNKKVFSFVTLDPYRSNPFYMLTEKGYAVKPESRLFVYETAERLLPYKFQKEFPVSFDRRYNELDKQPIRSQIKDFVFYKKSESLYDLILKQSYFTSRLYSFIAMVKFKLFGYISPMTSVYITEPEPWLFYQMEYTHELGGFYYSYTDEEIRNYAENILKLKNNLKRLYNLDLLFLPVPTRYTIYHKFVNNDTYNNFLPRLYKELDKREVNYVNLYTTFINSPDTLYHGTDTHWNPQGVDIALKIILEKIDHEIDFTNIPGSKPETKILSNY